MQNDALCALLHDDTNNTTLCQVLAPLLGIADLCALAHVCRPFRSWVADNGSQCFLGVTLKRVESSTLAPWQHQLTLNGQGTVCKKNAIRLDPQIYWSWGTSAEGEPMVEEVAWGSQVDTLKSNVYARLLDAETGDEVEHLGTFPLFRPTKSKAEDARPQHKRCKLRKLYIWIHNTLSSHQTPPGMYKLQVTALVALLQTGLGKDYSYTSDRFFVVSAPPKKGSANERARREEPYRRARVV
jgi:hypothetical protein